MMKVFGQYADTLKPSKRVTHYGQHFGKMACGVIHTPTSAAYASRDPKLVTCKRCRNTLELDAWIAICETPHLNP